MTSHWKIFKLITLPALIWSLSSCSGPSKGDLCQGRDWYEIGRRDGTQGFPLNEFSKHENACSRAGRPDRALYENGRNAGLIEYCTPEMALEMGRSGRAYQDVCPDHLESRFVTNFERGRQVYVLERENALIDQKLDELKRELTLRGRRPAQTDRLQEELNSLREKRTFNANEIQRIQSEVARAPE